MPGGSLRRLSQTLGENTVSAMAQRVGLPWPPPPPLSVRKMLLMAGDRALVLSGGGATGSFQAGVIKYLYEHGLRPAIICGTSVGAVNALKLAEGEGNGTDPNRGSKGLEKIWLGMNSNSDMYRLDDWVLNQPQWIQDILNNNFNPIFSVPELLPLLTTTLFPFILVDVVERAIAAKNFFDTAKAAHGIYNLEPILTLAKNKIDLQALACSNIRLRMTTVGLQSGALRYVTEKGWLVEDPTSDTVGTEVDIFQGMIASASIPTWFDAQKMAGDWYVDGGIREEVPIQAAVALKATEGYAVVSPKPVGNDNNDYANKGLIDIALRAATDVTIDEILQNDIAPFGGWGIPVHVIRATVEVEGSRTIDPGLIRINIVYGYMRAYDVCSELSAGPDVLGNSDQIASCRTEIWAAENALYNDAPNVNWSPDTGTPSAYQEKVTGDILAIRAAKTTLKHLYQARLDIAGANSMPLDPHDWTWFWEDHQWDLTSNYGKDPQVMQIIFPPSPWEAFHFTVEGHTVLDVPAAIPPM